ncbi:hypothetical protein SFRURICE_010672 [Spodoptera frugiperda]|uniref:SFRICE_025345 n=1 Tax=Spodoptera frugiperda TaxID=7108 RepID=A0A2H1V596_SPOFR|nr:hypothetical protein SFRURICE_010672 [Spodoptera frugiperda]
MSSVRRRGNSLLVRPAVGPNYGQISRNEKPPDRPIKFQDNVKQEKQIDIDKVRRSLLLADVSLDNEGDFNNNNRISNNVRDDSVNAGKKIKFEEHDDINDDIDDDDQNDDYTPRGRGKIVFEDGKTEDDFPYADESETDEETVGKPIRFEDQGPNINTKNQEIVTERVVFIDDNNQKQEPVRNRIRKSRKLRFQSKQPNQGPTGPNPYPGLGYPGYPGIGYPGSGYPVPSDPNSGYPGYPIPAYPTPGYPYPGYPTPYPGASNPDSRYPIPPYSNPGLPIGSQNGQLGFPNPTPGNPYYQGYPVPGYAPGYPGYLSSQHAGHRPGYGYLGGNQPGYQNGNGRPSRRPKSLTQRAVSAVAEALTSIALYDDQQCVPKILCEVAGGSKAVSSPALLKATESLQPLLTLLAAYNGLSASPLFLFGRAAVTGMSANGDPSVCRRTYPQCPNDPEKLVHYLNNHNGGFFRFFGQPEQSQQPQNLEQFYNYLSGQYGLQQQPQQQQNYGLLRPFGQGYGYLNQNPYTNPQNYAQNYYQQNRYRNGNEETAESEIQERIQNKPVTNNLEDENDYGINAYQDNGSKWSFPEDGYTRKGYRRDQFRIHKEVERPTRGDKILKFPDDRSGYKREIFRIKQFPRTENQVYYPGYYYNYQLYSNYQTTTPVNLEEYVFDHKHNFYVKRPKAVKVDDVNVVYVVRGNGDPNHPEVVRIRPGQSITK